MSSYEKFEDFLSDEIKSTPGLKTRIKQAEALIDIAVSLRKFRIEKNMTQKELANLTGTSQANIARWESPGYTEYTLSSLMKLADALDARIDIRVSENTIATKIKDDHFRNAGKIMKNIRSKISSSEGAVATNPQAWGLKNA